jgi:uncharacterized membrane protein
MNRIAWSAVLYNLCFALNCLLLFLVLFGSKMVVPGLLQVAGRMHPLVLHFPIVLLVLAAVWEIGTSRSEDPMLRHIGNSLLLSTATTSVLAALMGLFLSKEGGYDEKTLFWHQWSGVLVSFLAWGWYVFRTLIRANKGAVWLVSSLGFLSVTVAGHQGATLTHGENYLFAPVVTAPEKPLVLLENAMVYEHVVRPILKEKCMNCHNSSKSKGDLNMETEALLLKGGKNGVLWDSSASDFGLLLQRVHLPIEEKEHMPPKGKPQLTEAEAVVLMLWIKNGANFNQKLSDLPENDPVRQFAQERRPPTPYPFEAAEESIVQQLNNDYRVVYPLAQNSPALAVDFYGIAAFKGEYLKELEMVKTQVVSLNLNKMPLQDKDLKAIAVFPNLSKLNLAFTSITGANLNDLKPLKSLQSLSLSGTSVKMGDLGFLSELSELRELFLWNTAVKEAELSTLKQQLPGVKIESGFKGEGIVAKLNPPMIEGDEQVFSSSTKVKLKNYIKGAVLRYTLDGTVPDSLNAPISTGDSILIERSCQLRAKAFLPGWVSSEVSSRSFYKTGILPDSIVLRFPPNVQYKGEGPKTLANKKIGDTDFRTNKWLGYKETDLEALFLFHQPTSVSSVSLSTLVDIGSYIMPAKEIQVWGGNSKGNLVLLKKLIPEQPQKVGVPGYRVGYTFSFEQRTLSVVKIVVKPLGKLPAWHPGKGDLAWVFVDEVFVE